MKDVKIFGDSILQGVYFDGRYHKTKDKIKLDGYNIENYSRMGNTIEDGIKNIERHINDIDENTTVILEYGGNDCNYNWAEVSDRPDEKHLCAVEPECFKEKYLKAIKTIKDKGCKVILSSLIPISPTKYMNFISKNLSYQNILKWLGSIETLSYWQEYYNKLVEEIAQFTNCDVMPLRNAFSFSGYENMLCIDGIHPTVEGHKLIHKYIEKYLCENV